MSRFQDAKFTDPEPSTQIPKRFVPLVLGSVFPIGWMKTELTGLAEGITGKLDEWYPTVGKSNGWLGGNGDVWERAPYWLDGLVPLAHQLRNRKLLAKAQPYIEWTLSSQDASGYFGPRPENSEALDSLQLQRTRAADWWPRMVMLKVLQQHYEATGDVRVLEFMLRYFRYQKSRLEDQPLDFWSGWGGARGGENQASVLWLYAITGESFLLELSDKIFRQTYNWTDFFSNGLASDDYWMNHSVNVAMALKQPAVQFMATGETRYLEAIEDGFRDLTRLHGLPIGMFSGDERLHGTDPSHGVELCTIVETMFSIEFLMQVTGDVKWMDRLERIAFNALPAQISRDFRSRQYFQQVNQISTSNFDRGLFTEPYSDALCFGLLTGFPCCTTNLHQGWPKLLQSAWATHPDGGLACLIYLPSLVDTTLSDGNEITIRETTNYPMDDAITFQVLKTDGSPFSLHFRIPGWSRSYRVSVNNERLDVFVSNGFINLHRAWQIGDTIELVFDSPIQISRWHENSIAVHKGPLLFALPLSDQVRTPQLPVHRKNWNVGIVLNNTSDSSDFEVLSGMVADDFWAPTSGPGIRVKGSTIPHWREYNESAGPLPRGPLRTKDDEPINLVLRPYGTTRLRIAAFPEIQIKS